MKFVAWTLGTIAVAGGLYMIHPGLTFVYIGASLLFFSRELRG